MFKEKIDQREKVEKWLVGAKKVGYKYVMVVTNMYDQRDFRIPCMDEENLEECKQDIWKTSTLKIDAIYDLSKSIEKQLDKNIKRKP